MVLATPYCLSTYIQAPSALAFSAALAPSALSVCTALRRRRLVVAATATTVTS